MFNNDKKSKQKSSQQGSNNLPAINMISEGTKIDGALRTNDDVRVAGEVDGEASSKGKFILTSTGKIEGDVKASDADIAGKVEGELRVSNKLILRQSAVVTGDIHTKILLVEEGAQFDGACNMSSNPATNDLPKNDLPKDKKKAPSLTGSD